MMLGNTILSNWTAPTLSSCPFGTIVTQVTAYCSPALLSLNVKALPRARLLVVTARSTVR